MTTYNGSVTRTVTCNINLSGSFDQLRQSPDQSTSTLTVTNVTTDSFVLQNGTCSFVSNDPAGAADIPWFDMFTPGATFPATGASVCSTGSQSDGKGGGTVGLSIQAAYVGGQFNFLDTSATTAGSLLVFDDSTGALHAGMSTQNGAGIVLDTLQWEATNAVYEPAVTTEPQAVRR